MSYIQNENEIASVATLAQAKESLLKLENTTERIKGIIDKKEPIVTRKTARAHLFSGRFVSFILVCLVLMNAVFGMILYQTTSNSIASDSELTSRINKLETEVRQLKANQ
jgi:hypothetical protein